MGLGASCLKGRGGDFGAAVLIPAPIFSFFFPNFRHRAGAGQAAPGEDRRVPQRALRRAGDGAEEGTAPDAEFGGWERKNPLPRDPPVGQELPTNAGGGLEPGLGPQNGAVGAFWGEDESRDGFGEPRGGLGCGEGEGKILPELFGVIPELLG